MASQHAWPRSLETPKVPSSVKAGGRTAEDKAGNGQELKGKEPSGPAKVQHEELPFQQEPEKPSRALAHALLGV